VIDASMSAGAWRSHDASDASYDGALSDLHAGHLRGVVIRSVLAAETAGSLVAVLEADRELPRVPMGSRFIGESLGLGLDRAVGERRADYLDAADVMERRLHRLPGEPLVALLEATLHRLASPRGVSRATDEAGRAFAPLVFRRLPTGGRIPPHAELEQLDRAPYASYKQRLEGSTIISFFLCLQASGAGGALRVHELSWRDYDHRHDHRGHTDPSEQLKGRAWQEPAIPTGSLVLFDSGRWFHEVTPVEGETTRWTAGGFIARAAGDDAYLYWS
jgi:hypothetical protein